ncbi:Uncharacterized protein FWK35_00010521 [Aphis craccivora]|uniref:Uncharacterized protein n=1 Tax=Aphis craccivora TaxID=307492 RepID=A0A6G0Z5S5_APHCR|nr:Uncharacterized protein FWK35_00010521 [Aphis craccivora]
MNLVVFKSAGKNQKQIEEKREFLHKTSFRPNRFFYMVVIQKLITVPYEFISHKYLKIFNLNSGIFRPLKHKPPFSPTIRNYILG